MTRGETHRCILFAIRRFKFADAVAARLFDSISSHLGYQDGYNTKARSAIYSIITFVFSITQLWQAEKVRDSMASKLKVAFHMGPV